MNQNVIEKFNNLLGEENVKVNEPMKTAYDVSYRRSGRLLFTAVFFGRGEGNY